MIGQPVLEALEDKRVAALTEAGLGPLDGALLLAEILVIQGRVAEADALFDDLDLGSLPAAERGHPDHRGVLPRRPEYICRPAR